MGGLSSLVRNIAGIKQDSPAASSCAHFALLKQDADNPLACWKVDPSAQARPAELKFANFNPDSYVLVVYRERYPSRYHCTAGGTPQRPVRFEPSSLRQRQFLVTGRSFIDKPMAINEKGCSPSSMALAQNIVVSASVSRAEK